jgi:hypothetical protein
MHNFEILKFRVEIDNETYTLQNYKMTIFEAFSFVEFTPMHFPRAHFHAIWSRMTQARDRLGHLPVMTDTIRENASDFVSILNCNLCQKLPKLLLKLSGHTHAYIHEERLMNMQLYIVYW